MVAGRPRKVIDWDLVEKLSTIQCTTAEIARIIGVSESTLDHNKKFVQIHKKGLDEGRMSLRRLQWKKANDGNVTMLIWLGKQYLGQKDRQEISGENGPIVTNISVVSENAKKLTEEILEGKGTE